MILDSYEWYQDSHDKYFLDVFPDYIKPKAQEILRQNMYQDSTYGVCKELCLRLNYSENTGWYGVETFFRVLKDNLNSKYAPRIRFDGGTTIYSLDDVTIDELKYSVDLHLYWIF